MNSLIIAAFVGVFSVCEALPTKGDYSLSFETENITRIEDSSSGNVVGTYSYKDTEGGVHTINYVASDKGFKASGDVIHETDDVAQARAAHLAQFAREKAGRELVQEIDGIKVVELVPLELTKGPEDDDEIVQAKAAHVVAHTLALARLAEEYNKKINV